MSANEASFKKLLSAHITHPWLDALKGAWPVGLRVGEDDRPIRGDDWRCAAVDQLAGRGDTTALMRLPGLGRWGVGFPVLVDSCAGIPQPCIPAR